MPDETPTDKIKSTLTQIRQTLAKQRDKLLRLQAKIESLAENEAALVKALEVIGEEIPGQPEIVPVKRGRQQSRIRALDAALQVVQPGEELGKREVASRVVDAKIDIKSSNLSNALATAMGRATAEFENLGGGRFRRLRPIQSAMHVVG